MEITARDGQVCIDGEARYQGNPSPCIRQALADNKAFRDADLPTFAGGFVGYFSYDYLKYAEPALKLDARDDEGFNDVDLMLFDKVIAYDNYRQKIVLIKQVRVDRLDQEYHAAARELEQMANLILTGTPISDTSGQCTSEFHRLFSDEDYTRIVARAQERIAEGDIFQVVLSNPWTRHLAAAC